MARKPNSPAVFALVAGSTLALAVAAIAQAQSVDPGYALLTEAEGAEAVTAGLAELVEGVIDGDRAGVKLTEAGVAALAALNTPAGEAPTSAPSAASSAFVIEDAVPLPGAKRGGRGNTIYPFDALNVGQSFHVATTAENPTPAKSLASTVSSATARYAVEVAGQTEVVTLPVYQTDAAGKKVKDANGNWIKTGTRQETRPKMQETRKFTLRAVDASDPKGAGARVWRTA